MNTAELTTEVRRLSETMGQLERRMEVLEAGGRLESKIEALEKAVTKLGGRV